MEEKTFWVMPGRWHWWMKWDERPPMDAYEADGMAFTAELPGGDEVELGLYFDATWGTWHVACMECGRPICSGPTPDEAVAAFRGEAAARYEAARGKPDFGRVVEQFRRVVDYTKWAKPKSRWKLATK